ncbi:hypothetical protein [Allokutzneria albata]|uniref:Uncharacterized protein n=1 Tax=Allokutzneria albata TaxID=211114 RepID=A0A1G9SB58_ALLAB|nr:hypothetical protein [Allokutzneria albata]SDM32580.1 hypothetical protein SAMN04489726_1025 [Allokutzneria albata]
MTVAVHRTTVVDSPPTGKTTLRNLGWPTTLNTNTGGVELHLGSEVDALTLRAGWAAEVNAFLRRHMFRAPIFVTPACPTDWTFLTQRRTHLRATTWEDLLRLNVGWKPCGATMSLPAPDGAWHRPHWLHLPAPGEALPPWTAVVGAIRSVAHSAAR